jgi:hypothetical protein
MSDIPDRLKVGIVNDKWMADRIQSLESQLYDAKGEINVLIQDRDLHKNKLDLSRIMHEQEQNRRLDLEASLATAQARLRDANTSLDMMAERIEDTNRLLAYERERNVNNVINAELQIRELESRLREAEECLLEISQHECEFDDRDGDCRNHWAKEPGLWCWTCVAKAYFAKHKGGA